MWGGKLIAALYISFVSALCFVSTYIFACKGVAVLRVLDYRKSIGDEASCVREGAARLSLQDRFFAFAERESTTLKLYSKKQLAKGPFSKLKTFEEYGKFAGLPSSITLEGICEARLKLGFLCALFGVLFGLLYSSEFAVFAGLLGFALGIWLVSRWIKQKSATRANDMEKNLSEMLDVLSICLRSGLSLDLSIDIYSKSFDSELGREFLLAKNMWQGGLKHRHVALRDIANSYDSRLFSRTIEAIVRSLRLGTSLSEGLVDSSKEARAVYKSKREEEVCKAPIKMMIPTGVLILPAMLLLILGPVLLELASGGF